MRIAVAGKGGAGKTTFCATAARLIARRRHHVVAIDGDTNPNLHVAIGIDPATYRPMSLPASLVSRRLDRPGLTRPVGEMLAEYGAVAPDGVRLLRMGVPEHPDEGCLCSAHATVSAVLAALSDDGDTVVLLDLEASPEHLSRGTARHADVLVLVAEPYFRSLEAARLQAALAAETSIGRVVCVANKCRTADDGHAIAEFCRRHEIDLIGTLPWSDAVLDADSVATPLIDHDPSGDLTTAIAAVVDDLLAGHPHHEAVMV